MRLGDAPTPEGCTHQPRRLEFPGGHALLPESGQWYALFDDRPGEVFSIDACPVCLTPLWGIPPDPNPWTPPPAVAHSSRWRPSDP